MDAQITREMVDAARDELPGAYNRAYVRRALTAAIALIPTPEPTPAPAVEPVQRGSLAEIARRRGVARSTVTGWAKNRAANGMPEPVDGDLYDLAAIDAWHEAWKTAG